MSNQSLNEEFSVVVVSMKNEEEKIKNPDRTVILDSEQDERQGKDELNIVELPFALISNRNSKQIKTIKKQWKGQDKLGKSKQCYQTITGSNDKGLPTFQAEMVAIAAMELTFKNQLNAPVVNTTQYEMCKLLGWPYTSQYRKLLRDMFALLKGLTIETNHFYNPKTGEHEWAVFGIIDNAQFGSREGFFKWNDVFFQSLKHGNIKSLDTQIYFSLKRNLSKRLFRYADRHVYKGQKHEIDLNRLCYDKLLMLGKYQGAKHLIRKIQPAIDEINELEKDGVKLFEIEIVKSKTTVSGLKLVFSRPLKSRQSVAAALEGISQQGSSKTTPEANFEAPEGHSADSQTTQLAQMLIERGIRPRPAGELAKKFPDRIPHAVEVFDFLCSQPDNQIKSKPAFLRKAVEEHWFRDASSLPEGFVSKEEQEDERRSREQARQDLRVEYRQAQAKVKAEVGDWADLSPEQRISGRLDLWIMEFRRRHGKNPSEDEERRRSEKYIQELPTQEQMLTNQLNDLRRQFEQKAKEQGIEDIHFHATEEVHS